MLVFETRAAVKLVLMHLQVSHNSHLLAPIAEWPFQQVCADFFENEGHSYLTIVDRFSSWLNIYHFPHQTANSNAIINYTVSFLVFIIYGVSEELSTDGGPQFTSNAIQQYLKDWGVKHRLSSAGYPQSNGRAELAVKSAKRINSRKYWIMIRQLKQSYNTEIHCYYTSV